MSVNDRYGRALNRCQPGYGASCALCCGSHNYAMPPDRIDELFRDRGREPCRAPAAHPYEAVSEKLFEDDMQCRHVGIRSSDPGQVCCLAYDDRDRDGELESFFNGTCKNFYCPAWDHLEDREVLFAARLMGDWYYYSLFINDIETLKSFCARFEDPEDVTPGELDDLKSELVERLFDEDGK